MSPDIEQLKYPIGKFKTPEVITQQQVNIWISQIEQLPALLRHTSSGLSDEQLDTPYRENGWTLRQVIHHVADSHMNAYIRWKLTMTEENPVIRPYEEQLWAECEEAKNGDIEMSLQILETLHYRWVLFIRSLSFNDLDRSYIHPAQNEKFSLKKAAGLYAWHGLHHLNHILKTIESQKWRA